MNYRGAWQQALSVLGRNTSRTAPVRNQSPALYRDLAGSCSKILPSAQAGLSGQMPAQTLSVMSVTGLQSGVGSPATTGPKRSVPFLRLARPKSPHQNRKAVRPTATLPHCLKRILTISLALNLILRPLYGRPSCHSGTGPGCCEEGLSPSPPNTSVQPNRSSLCHSDPDPLCDTLPQASGQPQLSRQRGISVSGTETEE